MQNFKNFLLKIKLNYENYLKLFVKKWIKKWIEL